MRLICSRLVLLGSTCRRYSLYINRSERLQRLVKQRHEKKKEEEEEKQEMKLEKKKSACTTLF